jgi:hypothetical protein
MGNRPVRSAADHAWPEIDRAVERRGGGTLSDRARHVEGGGASGGCDSLTKRVKVSEGCGEGEGRELAEERGGEIRDPVDESTG